MTHEMAIIRIQHTLVASLELGLGRTSSMAASAALAEVSQLNRDTLWCFIEAADPGFNT